VRDSCTDDVNVANFTIFYFCQMNQLWPLMILIGLWFIGLCFRVISAISEEYLSIALGNISKRLGLSEALTGVTLLAYANGSPDIISSMVAGDQDGGALLSIGALYGASLFTCNFVCASVIHSTPGDSAIKLSKELFLRDIMTFFAATTILIFFGFLNISTLWVSLILFSIYATYVCIVGYQEYRQRREREANGTEAITKDLVSQATIEEEEQANEKKAAVDLSSPIAPEQDSADGSKHMQGRGLARFFKNQRHKIKEECQEGNLLDKFFFVFEYPISLVFAASIPPGEKEEYHSALGAIYPFTTLYAVLISTQQSLIPTATIFGIELYLVVWALPLQVLLSVLIFRSTKNGDPRYPTLVMLVTAVMSVIWIYLIANLIMDILNLVQAVSGFSKVFLGLTLLSLGNSLGDLFVDTALAKQGFTTMAFTGIFSGQLLNLLIGFALNCFSSYLKNRKNHTDTSFSLFDDNLLHDKKQFLCFFVMAFSSLRLASYILIGVFGGFTFQKFHKFVGLGVYCIFVLSFLLFEFVFFRNSSD